MLLVQFKVMWIFSRHLHMQRPVPPKICADYHSICSMHTVWEVFCLKYVPQIIVGYQKSSRHIRFWPHAIYCMSLPQVSSMSSACYQGFFGGEFFLTLKRLAHWFGSHYKRWTQREPGLLSLLLLACSGASAGPRGSRWLNTCSLVVPETTSLCQLLHRGFLL